MAEPRGGTFTIEGNRLTVRGRVGQDECDAFKEALAELIESGEKNVVVDTTGIQSVRSIWVGVLAAAMDRASTRHVAVKVVGTPQATVILEAAGLSMLGELCSAGE
jgi:anti-anti-sigma regulatory factor